MNYFKTAILLAAITALFLVIGYLLAGEFGMVIALIAAIGTNAFSYWNSDKMVLRMHNAEEVDARSAPEFYEIVRQLADNADLPMPRVYVIHNQQPNAFATGRGPEHAAIAASTGLLEMLNTQELIGVLAHEFAHIKNRDILLMTITATFAGAISMIANFSMFFGGRNNSSMGTISRLALIFIAPMAASIVQMAISRTREYAADRLGAELCNQPLWLASALSKMSSAGHHHIENPTAERYPATAHMFIVNPLSGRGMDNLFSTHPKTENRVAALEELAYQWQTEDGESRIPAARTQQYNHDDAYSHNTTPRGPWG